MDIELMSQVKRAEIEREMAQIRLAAAARGAEAQDGASAAAPAREAAPPIALRLLRALRSAS